MFCNYCGTSNPAVARFCRKCGKPIASSPPPSSATPIPIDPPPVDPAPGTALVAQVIPPPIAVVALLPVSSDPYAVQPQSRPHRRMIAVIAASLVVLAVGIAIFIRARSDRPRTLEGHNGFISSIAFSPDGRMLASSDSDGNVKLWDTVRSQWLRTFTSRPNTDWVTFSPDGHTLATWGSSSGHVVILWDTSSGTQTRVLGDSATSVGEPAFSPDGHLLVTDVASPGSDDRGLRLWDAASGSELRRFPGYMDAVFGPDGKVLAAWNKDHSISLLDVESGNEVRRFGGHKGFLPPDVVFSPDGRLLASTNDNAVVTVWDVASGNKVRDIADTAEVRGIAFSPDSRLLASGSEDHTIKLWEISSGNKVRTLSGHSDSVNCVAFSSDGHLLASGGADGNVILWPLP